MSDKDIESLRRHLVQKIQELSVADAFEGAHVSRELADLVRRLKEAQSGELPERGPAKSRSPAGPGRESQPE